MTGATIVDGLLMVEGTFMMITGQNVGGNRGWGEKYTEQSKKNVIRMLGFSLFAIGGFMIARDIPEFMPAALTSMAATCSFVGGIVGIAMIASFLMLKKKDNNTDNNGGSEEYIDVDFADV